MKTLLSLIMGLVSTMMLAQTYGKPYNQFSTEFGYGVSIPTHTVSNISNDAYLSTAHFNFGVRYMFNQDWGVKTQLAMDQFKEADDTGTNFFRVDVQAYYNLGKALNLVMATREQFGLFAHSGVGVAYSKSVPLEKRERVGHFIVGLSPRYRLNDMVSLALDFSYTFNFRQHFNFDGQYANPDKSYSSGGFFTPSLGIVIGLGSERRHADWY